MPEVWTCKFNRTWMIKQLLQYKWSNKVTYGFLRKPRCSCAVGWNWQRHVWEHSSPWRVPVEKQQLLAPLPISDLPPAMSNVRKGHLMHEWKPGSLFHLLCNKEWMFAFGPIKLGVGAKLGAEIAVHSAVQCLKIHRQSPTRDLLLLTTSR